MHTREEKIIINKYKRLATCRGPESERILTEITRAAKDRIFSLAISLFGAAIAQCPVHVFMIFNNFCEFSFCCC